MGPWILFFILLMLNLPSLLGEKTATFEQVAKSASATTEQAPDNNTGFGKKSLYFCIIAFIAIAAAWSNGCGR